MKVIISSDCTDNQKPQYVIEEILFDFDDSNGEAHRESFHIKDNECYLIITVGLYGSGLGSLPEAIDKLCPDSVKCGINKYQYAFIGKNPVLAALKLIQNELNSYADFYNPEDNNQLFIELQNNQIELHDLLKNRHLPNKHTLKTDYELAEDQPKFSGNSKPQLWKEKSSEETFIFKPRKDKRKISAYECVFAALGQLLIGHDRVPEKIPVYDPDTHQLIGLVSKEIPGLTTFFKKFLKENLGVEPQFLIDSGFGRVLALHYLLGDDDFHSGNIFFYKEKKAMSVDHDRCGFPITRKYTFSRNALARSTLYMNHPFRTDVIRGEERPEVVYRRTNPRYQIHANDIRNSLLHLFHSSPFNWVNTFFTRYEKNLLITEEDVKRLQQDKRFNRQIFKVLIKAIVIPETVIKTIINDYVSTKFGRKELSWLFDRINELKNTLLGMDETLTYLQDDEFICEMINELVEYTQVCEQELVDIDCVQRELQLLAKYYDLKDCLSSIPTILKDFIGDPENTLLYVYRVEFITYQIGQHALIQRTHPKPQELGVKLLAPLVSVYEYCIDDNQNPFSVLLNSFIERILLALGYEPPRENKCDFYQGILDGNYTSSHKLRGTNCENELQREIAIANLWSDTSNPEYLYAIMDIYNRIGMKALREYFALLIAQFIQEKIKTKRPKAKSFFEDPALRVGKVGQDSVKPFFAPQGVKDILERINTEATQTSPNWQTCLQDIFTIINERRYLSWPFTIARDENTQAFYEFFSDAPGPQLSI